MIDAPLALGFAAGMVAAFNPCGFALVPAYLSFFLGGDTGHTASGGDPGTSAANPLAPVVRALVVGGAVTVGFVVVFGAAGVLATSFSLGVQRVAPWVSIPIGLVLTALGVATVLGWKPVVALPRLAVGGRSGGLASMALYGASYATVSLSCTLPVFLAAVATTFEDASFLSGMAVFVAYALGMGTVLTGLAVAMVAARGPLAHGSRRLAPVMARLAGALLAVAGAYVTWYAVYEIRLEGDDDAAAGPVVVVTRWSGQVSNWVNELGPGRVAAGVIVLLLASTAALVGMRRRSGPSTGTAQPCPLTASPPGPGHPG
ncbi:MAG: cytochrome c biogenesis CcdA family protein [Acidimicrobiales bacterium]